MATKTRITVQSNISQVVQGRIPGLGAGGGKVIEAALGEVGEEAVRLGRQIIQTTPSSLVPGKPNRVYTGRMLDAVQYFTTHSSRYNYNLYAGWVNGDPGYFELQDQGGTTDWGQEVEGMFMMQRLRDFVRTYGKQVIADAIQRG